jgi:hypothetical protein
MWESRRLTTLWASTACYRDSFTFTSPSCVLLVPRDVREHCQEIGLTLLFLPFLSNCSSGKKNTRSIALGERAVDTPRQREEKCWERRPLEDLSLQLVPFIVSHSYGWTQRSKGNRLMEGRKDALTVTSTYLFRRSGTLFSEKVKNKR